MNTVHEDFIGHTNGITNGTSNGEKDGFTEMRLNYSVIRKGYLSCHNQNLGLMKFGSRKYWFVLTSDSLSWYKNETETEIRGTVPLDGLKLKEVEFNNKARRNTFTLYHTDGRNLLKDSRTIDLSCENQDELDSWKASFLRAGVYPK